MNVFTQRAASNYIGSVLYGISVRSVPAIWVALLRESPA